MKFDFNDFDRYVMYEDGTIERDYRKINRSKVKQVIFKIPQKFAGVSLNTATKEFPVKPYQTLVYRLRTQANLLGIDPKTKTNVRSRTVIVALLSRGNKDDPDTRTVSKIHRQNGKNVLQQQYHYSMVKSQIYYIHEDGTIEMHHEFGDDYPYDSIKLDPIELAHMNNNTHKQSQGE